MGKMMRFKYPISLGVDFMVIHRRATDLFNRAEKQNRFFRNERGGGVGGEDDYGDEEAGGREDGIQTGDDDVMGANCDALFCFPPWHPCAHNGGFYETTLCGHNHLSCDDIPEYCFRDPEVGHCRNPSNRWYFSREKNDCALFPYSGCNTNNKLKENNFVSRDECLLTCKPTQSSNSTSFESLTIQNHYQGRDCVTTSWSRGPCNVTCGDGMRLKSRRIVSHPQNGGRRCPRRLHKHESCHVPCDTSPTWTAASGPSYQQRNQQPTMIGSGSSTADCQYSAWSSWSPCSRSCGEYSVQTRTRYVLNHQNAPHCRQRSEERRCNVMPCN